MPLRLFDQTPVKKSYRRAAETAEITTKSKEEIIVPEFIPFDLSILCASAVGVV
jgi:hypothetical protein